MAIQKAQATHWHRHVFYLLSVPDAGHRSSERGGNKRPRPNEIESSEAWHKGSEDFRVEVDGTPSDAIPDSKTGQSEPHAAPRLPVPPATQLKVLGLLRQQLTKKRSEISGGDPQEDRELAGSQACTSHARMALTYRASQKEIIEQCLQVALLTHLFLTQLSFIAERMSLTLLV